MDKYQLIRKEHVFIYLFLFTASLLTAQPDYMNQWPDSIFPSEEPYGNVKQITETAYTMLKTDSGSRREFRYKLILRYSPDGLLLSEEYYNGDGSEANRIDYSYENGHITLKTQSHPSVQNPDREIFITTDDGRISEAEKIFSKGNYGWKYRNSYDHNGRIILTSKYDRYWKWMLVYSRIFEYDDLGRLSATEGFGMKSELLWRDEYQYDEQNRISASAKYDPDKILVVRIENEYNDRGNFIRRKFFDTNNNEYAVYAYAWDYDQFGNWTVKITGREADGYSSDYIKPDSMVMRNIEYYE